MKSADRSLMATTLRGRILRPPLRGGGQPALARRFALHLARRQTTAAPASAEENSIPLGKDRGHIATAKGESIAFFDRE